MAVTPRTPQQAKEFITKAIADWEATGDEKQIKKIVSLSNWAEKWHSTTGGHIAAMKDWEKNKKAIELIMKRKLKHNPKTDNTALEKELETHKNALKDYTERYGELKAKKPKTHKKPKSPVV
jgi:hypothetical protein